MANEVARTLIKVAAKQDGLIRPRDALAAGISRKAFFQARTSLEWSEVQPATYATFATKLSFRQRVRAAQLSAGDDAVVGGCTAAALMHWDGFKPDKIVLILPRGRRRPFLRNVTLHHSRDLREEDVWNLAGFRATTPTRTFVDLALTCSREELVAALNGYARNHGMAGVEKLRKELACFAPHRTFVLREIIDDPKWRPTGSESQLESRILQILQQAGLSPVPQHPIRNGSFFIKRVDAAFIEERVALEFEGFATHGGIDPFHDDAAKHIDITALGWHVVRITNAMLSDPEQLVLAVRRALARGRAAASVPQEPIAVLAGSLRPPEGADVASREPPAEAELESLDDG